MDWIIKFEILQSASSASMLVSDGGVHPSIRTHGGIIILTLDEESPLLGLAVCRT